MASKIIGRRACPWCGFDSAHVKESDKCLYFFCPDCGTNGPHARTAQQRANMVKGMRAEGAAKPTATPTGPAPVIQPAAEASPTPTLPTPRDATAATPTAPTRKRVGLFSFGAPA